MLLDEPASGLDPEGRVRMLELIKRLGQFDIDVIVSSHVLTDIEQTCTWVVMLDAGNLLRSGPLDGFGKLGTVLVEVVEHPGPLAAALVSRGVDSTVDGRRLVVGPGDESLEQAIVEAAAESQSGLIRMIRGSSSLEDLFVKGSDG